MKRHLPLWIALGAIFALWVVQLSEEKQCRIRFDGHDTVIGLGYGEWYAYRHMVPETHFEVMFHSDPYPEESWRSLERLFGAVFPIVSLHEPDTMDGFAIPLWNLAAIAIGVWIVVLRLRQPVTKGQRPKRR